MDMCRDRIRLGSAMKIFCGIEKEKTIIIYIEILPKPKFKTEEKNQVVGCNQWTYFKLCEWENIFSVTIHSIQKEGRKQKSKILQKTTKKKKQNKNQPTELVNVNAVDLIGKQNTHT